MTQTARVLSFLRARPSSTDWTQQELAEFYRVESALLQSGLFVVTDRGVSDEGDPWFVFCRSESEDVIAHFARIDGYYLVASSAFSGTARGRDFRSLVRELIEAHPLMLPRPQAGGQKIFLHPAAMLASLLAASYLVSSDKHASIHDVSAASHEKVSGFWSQIGAQDLAILSAVAIAATYLEHHIESAFQLAPDAASLHDMGGDSAAVAHVTTHVADAGYVDTAAPELHDGAAAAHKVAGGLVGPVVLETGNDAGEAGSPPPGSSLTLDHSAAATPPESNPMPDGMASGHDGMKGGDAPALNDADALPAQLALDGDSGTEGHQPLAPSGAGSVLADSVPGSVVPPSAAPTDVPAGLGQANPAPVNVIPTDQVALTQTLAGPSGDAGAGTPAAATDASDQVAADQVAAAAAVAEPGGATQQPPSATPESLLQILEHIAGLDIAIRVALAEGTHPAPSLIYDPGATLHTPSVTSISASAGAPDSGQPAPSLMYDLGTTLHTASVMSISASGAGTPVPTSDAHLAQASLQQASNYGIDAFPADVQSTHAIVGIVTHAGAHA